MRNKRKNAGVIILIVVLISATSCSFFGKDVKITVNDNGNAVSVDGKDNMTVDEILKKAGITLSARDTVEPELSKRWSDAGAGEVTVKRYAKVTVTDGLIHSSRSLSAVRLSKRLLRRDLISNNTRPLTT